MMADSLGLKLEEGGFELIYPLPKASEENYIYYSAEIDLLLRAATHVNSNYIVVHNHRTSALPIISANFVRNLGLNSIHSHYSVLATQPVLM